MPIMHAISLGTGRSLTGRPTVTWSCSCGRRGSTVGTDRAPAEANARQHITRGK